MICNPPDKKCINRLCETCWPRNREFDYHQRFRERFGKPLTWREKDILAFIDETIQQDRKEQFAKEFEKRGKLAEAVRAEERAALIEKVESSRVSLGNLDGTDDAIKFSVAYNQALDDLFIHLRGESEEVTDEELDAALAGIQEETECCDGCKGLELIEAHTLCPCHKPRTEEPKAITGGVIGNGIPKWPRPLITSEETEKEGASFSGRGEVERTNELLRSMASIVARLGKDVNWDAFGAKLDAELKRQHAIMFPCPKENPTPPHFAGWKDTSTTPQSKEQGGENNK